MHHIHISTGFMFVVALFIFGLVGLYVWYRVDQRRQRERREQREAQLFADEMRARSPAYKDAPTATAAPAWGFLSTRAGAPARASAVSNTVIVQQQDDSFLSGVVMGEMLSRPTYVPGPAISAPDAPACPSPPADSGGIDISWGATSADTGSSSCDTGGSDGGFSVD